MFLGSRPLDVRLASFHMRVLQSSQQPTFQKFTNTHQLLLLNVVVLFCFEWNSERQVVEMIVRPSREVFSSRQGHEL